MKRESIERVDRAKPTLYIVGTPIGNLGDITLRALDVLGNVEYVACEDTRRTLKLLSSYGVKAKLMSFHSYSTGGKLDKILDLLASGNSVAYVTDAGMPTLSDPGTLLVSAARDRGFAVSVIPGVSALTTFLAYVPFGGQRFVFEGFLPRKGEDRRKRLTEIATRACPSVIFESPLRMNATLDELCQACGGGRSVVVARELTKKFEQVAIFRLSDRASVDLPEKGEVTLVVEGVGEKNPSPAAGAEQWWESVVRLRAAGLSNRDILRVLKVLAPDILPNLRRRVSNENER